MASFLVYRTTTGVIDRTGSVPDGCEVFQAQTGETMLLLTDPTVTVDTHYVHLPDIVVTSKPAMGAVIDKLHIAANGVAQAVISSVPVGADLFINGVYNQNIADGTVEFSTSVASAYVLELRE